VSILKLFQYSYLTMPRGVMLTQEEQTNLKTYRKCRVSNRKIAKNIGRSLNVLNNFSDCVKIMGK